MITTDWLSIHRGTKPLVVTLPHTGTRLPSQYSGGLTSEWLALRDTDWWIEQLYDFSADLGATVIRTSISRTIIDVNRDPSGISLYPGMATTELCPTTTFDGEPLYRTGFVLSTQDIAERREQYFDPFHAAVRVEIERLRHKHEKVVLYDCHSIRSRIPRLFEGELSNFNIGTNSGTSADVALVGEIEAICDATNFSRVSNGRFKGGWITRCFGNPSNHVHAIQMELACRGYMQEPDAPLSEANWPTAYDPAFAAPIRTTLIQILENCLHFALRKRS